MLCACAWRIRMALGLVVFMGCASGSTSAPGKAVPAFRPSAADDQSRRLIRESFARLADLHTDYRVGPGDILEIDIFEWEMREETKTAVFNVSEGGVISLPVIGKIQVGGKTVVEIKEEIERVLTKGGFIKQPRVSVAIAEFQSKRVAVIGAVNDPGVYTLRRNATTLLDILSLAGGASERAGALAQVIVPGATRRPSVAQGGQAALAAAAGAGGRLINVDLYELMERGDMSQNVVLDHGAVVVVPEAKRFSVVGWVADPGSFSMKKPTTVLEGVAMARGIRSPEASPRHVVLKRTTKSGEEVIIPLDLVAISDGAKPNLYLQPNDVIDVRQTASHKAVLDFKEFFSRIFNFGIGYSVDDD